MLKLTKETLENPRFHRMDGKKYFFIIDPYVYFLKKEKNLFFYNTLTKKYLESNEKTVYCFLHDIQEGKNLSVKKISGKRLEREKKLKLFLLKLREGFFGDLVELEKGDEAPIQLYPILGLKRTEDGRFDFTGEQNTLDYLKNINIYLNDECELNCNYCDSAYKQFICCSRSGENIELDYKKLLEFIEYLKEYPSVNLTFTGGNIFKYKKFSELLELIRAIENKKSIVLYYKNLKNKLDRIKDFKDSSIVLNVLVDFTENDLELNKIQEVAEKSGVEIRFNFIIQNDFDLEAFSLVVNEVKRYSVRPYFNAKNRTFFRNNVYFNKTQILDQELSIKDIFFNQVFNKHFLGTVNLLNNGDFFINLNKEPVGNIKEETINDIANNELVKNGDWFLTRNKVEPCKDCDFVFLCPAISNYEFSIGKFDLCKVNFKKKNLYSKSIDNNIYEKIE